MKSILILGAKGMLGQELVRVFSDANGAIDANMQMHANDANPEKSKTTSGQVGNANDTNREEYSVTAWDREDVDPEKSQSDLGARVTYEAVDITDERVVRQKITDLWPDVIVNATAYNAVDLCETSDEERSKAEMLNAKVPGLLADIANDLQSTIVHYSTDYVFDGTRPKFREQGRRAPGCCGSGCAGCSYLGPEETFDGYREYDLPNPLSVYGKTKLGGEKEVEKRCQDHYIIRLSKLFGKPAQAEGAKRSFFDVMLEKAGYDAKSYADANVANGNANDANAPTPSVLRTSPPQAGGVVNPIKVVDGEKSCFTYAPDLAQKTRELIETAQPGIYHAVNAGAVTWYEATKKLFEIAGVASQVHPVSPDAFPRPAKRPSFSVLISKNTEPLRSWESAVKEYLGGS